MGMSNIYIWIAAAMIAAALIIIIVVLISSHKKTKDAENQQSSAYPNTGAGPTMDLNEPQGGHGQYPNQAGQAQPYNPNAYQPGISPQGQMPSYQAGQTQDLQGQMPLYQAGQTQDLQGQMPSYQAGQTQDLQGQAYSGSQVTENLQQPAFPGNPNMGMQAAPYQGQGYPYENGFDNEETVNESFDEEATVADLGARVVWMKFTISFEGRVETEERILHEQLVLGRSDRCDVDVVFNSKDEEARQTSREHALILNQGGGVYIRDNGSRNGTYVNDVRIEADTPLKSGDVVRIGRSAITVDIENPS